MFFFFLGGGIAATFCGASTNKCSLTMSKKCSKESDRVETKSDMVLLAHVTVCSSSMCILIDMEQCGNDILNCSINCAVSVSVDIMHSYWS